MVLPVAPRVPIDGIFPLSLRRACGGGGVVVEFVVEEMLFV